MLRARLTKILITLAVAGCSTVPGETLTSRSQQREVSARVLAMSANDNASCRQHRIVNTEIIDLHGDGRVAAERWTVQQCDKRAQYVVTFSSAGRAVRFTVRTE